MDISQNDQAGSSPKAWFFRHLRTLLGALYDPSTLGESPLLEWLKISPQPDSTANLRKFLIQAIDSLKPSETTPHGTKSSRVYEILRQRYIEQQTQRRVADNIGLSARQLQREEKIAVDILGEAIWRTYNLQEVAHPVSDPGPTPLNPLGAEQYTNQQQDLDWLKTTTPAQPTDINSEIQDIITTLEGVIRASKIKVQFTTEKEYPHDNLNLQTPIIRQGLLNVLGICISLVPGGQIKIQSIFQPSRVRISIEARGSPKKTIQLEPGEIESLCYAAKLIALCEGTLQTSQEKLKEELAGTEPADFIAEISLPVAKPITVLVIEDNADTLELYRRFLVNSRYRFVGASNAREGFSLAQKISPGLIVLDVMMPEKDGWSFLGQLKVHPKIQHIPVIISSILQQANLAETLGAAEFLHKPVSRVELLSCLDRQLERLATKSH